MLNPKSTLRPLPAPPSGAERRAYEGQTAEPLKPHLLSLALLIAALVEFLFVAKAATPTFFLFMVTCFVDLLSGVAFSLKAARPKVAFEGIDQTLRT